MGVIGDNFVIELIDFRVESIEIFIFIIFIFMTFGKGTLEYFGNN
jgi:hypothetical protein